MPRTFRSFFAFDIEDQTIIRRLTRVQEMLSNTGTDLKLVKPQNIHLTIRFLGDIYPSMVNAIYEEMKQLSFTPFMMEFKGVGTFPRLNNPRVVWVGINKGTFELTKVFEQLEPRLRGLGLKPETKGFNPHLTIARVKTRRNKSKLVRLIRELENYEIGAIKAKCLRLKKSDLTPRGPIYTNLREVGGK
jgi:2'-5' RNA ligase